MTPISKIHHYLQQLVLEIEKSHYEKFKEQIREFEVGATLLASLVDALNVMKIVYEESNDKNRAADD